MKIRKEALENVLRLLCNDKQDAEDPSTWVRPGFEKEIVSLLVDLGVIENGASQ